MVLKARVIIHKAVTRSERILHTKMVLIFHLALETSGLHQDTQETVHCPQKNLAIH